jgi:hypothetical protein
VCGIHLRVLVAYVCSHSAVVLQSWVRKQTAHGFDLNCTGYRWDLQTHHAGTSHPTGPADSVLFTVHSQASSPNKLTALCHPTGDDIKPLQQASTSQA